MTQESLVVETNAKVVQNIYMLVLKGNTSSITAPGQFINIKLDGLYLRRPMSIADWYKNYIAVIYRVVGEGTKMMSKLKEGTVVDAFVGLGNGFNISEAKGKRIILVGGGLGIAPLYGLVNTLYGKQIKFDIAIGFNSKAEAFGYSKVSRYAKNVFITTIDGSLGTKGLVTDVIDEKNYDYYYACGPESMLRTLHKFNIEGQLSLEARMGCGFGACMGCSVKTTGGYKRVCLEGPVMLSSELIFD